jgi:hypothetical protein
VKLKPSECSSHHLAADYCGWNGDLWTHLPKAFIPCDNGKQKYALGLISQAVKTIWYPENIPCAFVEPTKGPASPSASPPLVSTGTEMDNALLPLKIFVHKFLKCSHTSGSIMQTALCYLDAVRPKVPEILRNGELDVRQPCLNLSSRSVLVTRKINTLKPSVPSFPLP